MRPGLCHLEKQPQAGRTNDTPRPYLARFDEMKATGQLPTPTGVAMEIVRLAQDESASCSSLARVLMADPVLSGKVIKYANSALMQVGRAVSSVQEAVLRLGIGTLRRIALSFSLISAYRQGRCAQFDYQTFWSLSLARGVAAQELARQSRLLPPDEAFTTALLAHIGQLALACVYPDKYAELLQRCQGQPVEQLLSCEREVFAANHCELSAAMFLDWGLPAEQAAAVECYLTGEPEDAYDATKRLVRILRAAQAMAELCLSSAERRARVAQKLLVRAEPLQIPPLQLAELYEKAAQEWQTWGRILDVRTQSSVPIHDLLQNAASPAGSETAAQDTPQDMTDAKTAAALRVLVVESTAATRDFFCQTLRQAGHEVFTADDAESGLALVLQVLPQLIFVPLASKNSESNGKASPVGSGIQLCRQLRETRIGRHLYLVLYRESASEDEMVQAFEAGADDVISLPITPRLLLARLRACQRVVELQREIEHEQEELRRVTAELAIANRKLQEAALTDPLTGLPNRRYAFDRLQQEWQEAIRHDIPLACLVLDVDHFKRINDNHGHDVGDLVLKQAAELLRQAVRRSDVACRIGGEEFLIICPRTTLQGGQVLAERIRQLAEQKVWGSEQLPLRITVSVGVAARTAKGRSPEELFRQADQALYAAKQAGRNRVRIAPN
jgi:two-component system cell cycle response regulator